MKKAVLANLFLLCAVRAAAAVYYVDDVESLRDALWQVALDREPGEVVATEGTYVLQSDLRIYSNTTLTLEEGAVVRCANGADCLMLIGSHLDESGGLCPSETCRHGGYSQCHDIVVQGGVWDRNSSSDANSQAFLFRHADGITIRNLTVKRCTNHHVNLSGSRNVTIENCRFSDPIAFTGSDPDFWGDRKRGDADRFNTLEAIHLDFLDDVGEPNATPNDLTPCRDVLVSGCVFDGVFSGVGAHHPPFGDHAEDIVVSDCHFEGLRAYAVNLYGFDNTVLEGNTVSGGMGFVNCNQSSCRLSDNSVTGATQYPVFADARSKVIADGNDLSDSKGSALFIRGGSQLTATRNTISKTGDNAIELADAGQCRIDGNLISDAGKTAILSMGKTALVATGNVVSSPKTHGIATSDGASMTASGNTIRSAGKNGIMANGGSATLSGNTIESPGLHGIFGENSAKVSATGNTVRNAAFCGFSFQSKAKLTTGGKNIVSSPKRQGVLLASAAASVISGVQVTGSGSDGIRINKTDGCTVSKCTVSGVKDRKAGIVLEQCRSGTVTGNTVSSPTGHGIRIFGTKAVPATATVSRNAAAGARSTYFDIMLGDWSRKCKVIENTLLNKRFKISPTGTAGNVYRPLGTTVSKVTRKPKTKMVVKWKKQAQAQGYEIQYAAKSNFKGAKTKKASAKKTSVAIKGLAAKKKYWVRIRTYQTFDKKKYYSSWSAKKAVKP